MREPKTQPGFFASFFSFKRMVSPFFITLVYFGGLIAIIAGTGFAIAHALDIIETQTLLPLEDLPMWAVYVGFVVIGLLLILTWRFINELLIVLFGIFNRLADIKTLLETASVAQISSPKEPDTLPIDSVVESALETDAIPRTLEDEKPAGSPPKQGDGNALKGWPIRRRR